MKITKKKFVFEATMKQPYKYGGRLLMLEGGRKESIYVAKNCGACNIGARLNRWAGCRAQKVKITIEKVGK